MQNKTLIELIREYGDAQHMAAALAGIGSAGASSYRANADRLFAEIKKRVDAGPRTAPTNAGRTCRCCGATDK